MTSGIFYKMARHVTAIFGIATVIACSAIVPLNASARAAEGVEVVCAEGRGFLMRPDAESVMVEVEGQHMMLDRQPLPLGAYYRNRQAALVIDGDFVAFVPRGDTGWRDCRVKGATPTAQ